MILFGIFILWIAYACFSGVRDAYAFSRRVDHDNQILGLDIHKYIAGMRLVLTTVVHFLLDAYYSTPKSLMLTIALLLMHPLFHNGVYFEARKRRSGGTIYPDGFFTSKSKDDSSAIVDFNKASTRILLFVFGILLWNIGTKMS